MANMCSYKSVNNICQVIFASQVMFSFSSYRVSLEKKENDQVPLQHLKSGFMP